jgi:3-oxoadipate enol-lactonase
VPHLDRSGTRIWWEVEGSGTPLLIIQGLGYPSDASWRLLPRLRERHTVLLVDNRGVGRSDVPAGDVSIEEMAADAAAVVEVSGVGPVHVAGFSMGGLIAQELSLARPDLVRSLILGCTSPGGPAAVPFDEEVARHLAELATLPAREAAEKSAQVVYALSCPVSEIVADIDVRMARPTSRAGYLAQLMAVGRFEGTRDRLGTLTVPVLILHGDADRLVPPANAQILAHEIPRARLHMLSGAGHIFTTDATSETLSAILAFVAEQDATARR